MRRRMLILSLFAVVLLSVSAQPADLTGEEIVQKVSDLMNQPTAQALMKLTIVTTSGQEREFTYDSYTADRGEKSVIVYKKPIRVKGQATLMLNNADDIWSYFPRTDRVRKLATHAKKQKMQGSDFTYEDMGSGDTWVDEFDAERLADEEAEGHDCYKVILKKNEKSNSGYSSIVLRVRKDNFVPVVIDYYDEDEPDVCKKRLVQSDIKMIDGVPTPMKAVMHNNLDDTDTRLEIVECQYNVEIEESRFKAGGFYR